MDNFKNGPTIVSLARGKHWRDRKDRVCGGVAKNFFPKEVAEPRNWYIRLLYAALIEARSCDASGYLRRIKKDKRVADFYHKLMVSEAGQFTHVLNFARQYGDRKRSGPRNGNELLSFMRIHHERPGAKMEIGSWLIGGGPK